MNLHLRKENKIIRHSVTINCLLSDSSIIFFAYESYIIINVLSIEKGTKILSIYLRQKQEIGKDSFRRHYHYHKSD